MREKTIFHAAAYLRLSRDDDSEYAEWGESNSIRSQRDFIRNYVSGQKDIEIYDYYVDDGWSGVDFERPSFCRMMEDIRTGRVDCVIVKDLSRFGRDYIEAGRLIQKTFPAFSVRFIALNDDYDSLTADFNETALVLPVKNFVNDAYCGDISQKVRSHLKIKRERGDFIGAFPVYGYRKDPENKNRLITDAYAAGIVKKIFAWRIDGLSNLAIADKLNAAGVLSPLEYKKLHGQKWETGFATRLVAKWSAVAVKRILTNEMYTGVMVQGKSERMSHKVKRSAAKPKEQWVRVAGTHEAVVSEADFLLVQRLLKTDSRTLDGGSCHMFAGFLFCGDCGRPMIRRVNRYKGTEHVSFICSTRNRGLGCSRHSITEERLKNLVLVGLQRYLSVFVDRDSVTKRIQSGGDWDADWHDALRGEIQELCDEREKYRLLCRGLYEDWKRGILTDEDYRDFKRIYRTRREETEMAICRQEKVRMGAWDEKSPAEHVFKTNLFPDITEINRDVLAAFVNRILVYEEKRVSLSLRADMSGIGEVIE